jgi:riboflavin kinase/FMN adenylyltransferase
MEIVRGWRDVPDSVYGASLAIGNFDGVHRGHRAVLDTAKAASAKGRCRNASGCPVGAVGFERHPRKYFRPEKLLFLLTPLEHKLELLAEYGMAFTVVLPFDDELANLSAEEFVHDILVESLRLRHVTTGYNFFFGKGREGTPNILRSLGNKYDFGVTIVEAVGEAGEIFSSTRVRELLAEGDVAAAADMLGHFWQVQGKVENGAGRGAGLGFPTANIRLQREIALGHGIYAVRVTVNGQRHKAAAYLGTRPTFDAGEPLLESFLLDFDGDIYGQKIAIEFVDFLRADAKFKSPDDLAAQIQTDCAKAREILANVE